MTVAEVTVQYRDGLPVVSVPLPSRQESCEFTLKPVSHTVADFLSFVKEEDGGIERVAVYKEGESSSRYFVERLKPVCLKRTHCSSGLLLASVYKDLNCMQTKIFEKIMRFVKNLMYTVWIF